MTITNTTVAHDAGIDAAIDAAIDALANSQRQRVAGASAELAQRRLHTIIRAANILIAEGFTILKLASDAVSVRPIIIIANHPALGDMAREDRAVYYRSGRSGCLPYRVGQFVRAGAIVRWTEWGH